MKIKKVKASLYLMTQIFLILIIYLSNRKKRKEKRKKNLKINQAQIIQKILIKIKK